MRTRPILGLSARRCLSAAVCAVAAATGAPTAPAQADAVPNSHGVVSAVNGSQLAGESKSIWGPQLAAIQQGGVQEVRSDAPWAGIQPDAPRTGNPGFDWGHYDDWVAALASNGLTWEPILDYNTSWANAALNPQAFASFAAAVAARYGANGTFWTQHPLTAYLPAQIFEVWNEENVSTAYYMAPISYGKLYLATRSSIKALDPSAAVDIGGLSESGSPRSSTDSAATYVALMLATNPSLKGAIDAVALHPYAPSAGESEGWVVHFRHALSSMGVGGVPLDLTEFGWPYSLTTETWRATQMGDLGDALPRSNCGVRLAAPYDWVNPGNPAGADFGLVDGATGSPSLRPAGTAWFNAFPQGSAEPALSLC
jgi:hypothetical protein